MYCRCNDPVSHNITSGVLTHKLPPTKEMPVHAELPDYSLPHSDRREANSRSSVTAYQVSAADTKRCKFALDNKVRERHGDLNVF